MSRQYKGYLAAFVGSVGSGVFTIFYLFAGERITHIFAVFMLFLWALIFNTIFELLCWRNKTHHVPVKPTQKEKTWIVISFGLIFVSTLSGNYLYQMALALSDPVIVQTSNRFEIIVVVFLGWLIYRERLNAWFWLGTAVVVGGFVVMKSDAVDLSLLHWKGILLGALSGTMFGLFQTVTKYTLRFYSPPEINKYRLILSTSVLFFFPGIVGGIADLTPSIVLYTGMAAFFGPFLSRLSYIYAAKYIEISRSILFTAMAPFFTGFIQVVFLGIPVSAYEIAGIFIIVFGIIFSIRCGKS